MKASHDFRLQIPPEALAASLADPLNVGVSNRRARVVERSDDAATRPGSWSVVAVDLIRTRIEYLVFDPPGEVAVALTHSGPGSGGQEGTWRYLISEVSASGGCGVRIEIESPARATDTLVTLLLPLMWWQLGRHLATLG